MHILDLVDAVNRLTGSKVMTTISSLERRLQRELMLLIEDPAPGVAVDAEGAGLNLTQWLIHVEGAEGTLYGGERFQLQFKFSAEYPFDAPEVTFVGPDIPVNPHVYSNGHICISILSEDWSPALNVRSVCLSIISVLSSCKRKRRPPGDSFYVTFCDENPKENEGWFYNDAV
jgi:ubiquitin-conjugating enzyme E2 W